MATEKRIHHRQNCNDKVQIFWRDSFGREQYCEGKLLDVSTTGMRVLMPYSLPDRTQVLLRQRRLRVTVDAVSRFVMATASGYKTGMEFIGGYRLKEEKMALLVADILPIQASGTTNLPTDLADVASSASCACPDAVVSQVVTGNPLTAAPPVGGVPLSGSQTIDVKTPAPSEAKSNAETPLPQSVATSAAEIAFLQEAEQRSAGLPKAALLTPLVSATQITSPATVSPLKTAMEEPVFEAI